MLKKIMFFVTIFYSSQYAYANGGVALGATRLVYPIDSKQVVMRMFNSDTLNNYLVQSWTTNDQNIKDNNFIITPPLFVMKAGADNTIRLVYTGDKNALPKDRETLYYLLSKVIPASKKEQENKNLLYIANTSKIKIFLRPNSLNNDDVFKSIKKLKCSVSNGNVKLENPTPYYLNLITIRINKDQISPAETIAPFSSNMIKTSIKGNSLTYDAINDYGALVKENVCTF